MARKTKRIKRKQLRDSLWTLQSGRCAYCGVRMEGQRDTDTCFTVDHLQARVHGGRWFRDNVVGACLRCNNLRGLERPMEFFKRRGWTTLGGSDG